MGLRERLSDRHGEGVMEAEPISASAFKTMRARSALAGTAVGEAERCSWAEAEAMALNLCVVGDVGERVRPHVSDCAATAAPG